MVDSDIIQCQVCGQFRHRSWFHVGRRGCAQCYEEGRLWESSTNNLFKRLRDDERRFIKHIIFDWIDKDTFPQEITADERKVLLMRTKDLASHDVVARALGLKLGRVKLIESQAHAKIHRLAKNALPEFVQQN